MNESIRTRINLLKEKNNLNNDNELIAKIFKYKKKHGEAGWETEESYIKKNKGSFSQFFNGKRNFRPEDYLAIEYALNTSMTFIIDGKGEVPENFELKGIRYAAYSDTIGNYEVLLQEEILNNSDEYDKTLIDYMIDYKSKNGFKYFAEHDLLPLSNTGGDNYKLTCLNFYGERKDLLKILCDVLPLNLLLKYFDGFLTYQNIAFYEFDEHRNTSFTDEVIGFAIQNEALRKEFGKTKKINLDNFNINIRRIDGKTFGEGLFVNYGLTCMLRYALNHSVDETIRNELIQSAIEANRQSYEFVSTFSEDELKIDKFGFIADKYDRLFFGSVAIPSEVNVEISDKSKVLLNELNRKLHDYHELLSKHSSVSVFANEIFANKKDNEDYYNFFKFMNDKNINFIPLLKESDSKDKDLFEVSNSEKSRLSNSTDEDLSEIIKVLRQLDDISDETLKGKTYYLVDPTIYMYEGGVNYIMPKDIIVANKYSNLVRFINDHAIWTIYQVRNENRVKNFCRLIKQYGISKDEIIEFLDIFSSITEEQSRSVDRTSTAGKELALRMLSNKDWVEIYREEIIKEF